MRKIVLLLFIATITSCKTKEKSMKEIQSKVTTTNIVAVKTSEVWKKLVAFGGTDKFVPDLIERVSVKGNSVGAVRTIYLKGGGEIVEELTEIDSKNHKMEFIILSTPMPITNYTGIFEISKAAENSCEVTFTSKYKTYSENEKEMESVIKGFQETFISNLDK
ncbi:hypothetical protein SY27_16390 [Flavobacterium sp. 316]|uniref:SRPBCC family protein n=1 Tax=Flavobacterium sp. 316 TaxID=1603293 RepID=UPI0005EA6335|nr:SRPBCC family protein [Flavobacterium sp. 316]KIX20089.1 hypothetical protein SY27_16390 [Flavobacterium sp. 316]